MLRRKRVLPSLALLICLFIGCGDGTDREADVEPAPIPKAESTEAIPLTPAIEPEPDAESAEKSDEPSRTPRARREQAPRTLADLLEDVPDSMAAWMPNVKRIEVDEAAAAAAGIHKFSGNRLTLFTDILADREIEALPAAFDQAFPQWCEYFDVDPAEHADWRMTGFIMKDKSRFERLGLLPKELPAFLHGFARNYDFWLYEQPSAYYRRHLVLHEGTHGFMNTILGSCGPPWYMEGVAELLSTHRWQDGLLTLNHMPQNREEVPMWGRIRIVRDDYAAGRAQRLDAVLEYQPTAYKQTEPYAWCWAVAVLLDRHPRYQKTFRQLGQWTLEPDLTGQFRRAIGDGWPDLSEQWQVFVEGLEYGHDVPRAAIQFAPGEPLSAAGAEISIDAARGWQSSGVRLEAGHAYRIAAHGRYQVADRPQIWWSEPGGVSIRYYQGRPLGMLLAAVRADPEPGDSKPVAGVSRLLHPTDVGLGTALAPERSGTLYLRINDSAAELADNAGQLAVRITMERAADSESATRPDH